MKMNLIHKIIRLLPVTCILLSLTGCNDKLGGDTGEQETILFSTSLPGGLTTRSAMTDWQAQMGAYRAVSESYEFTVGMYEAGNLIGQSIYKPKNGDLNGTLTCKSGQTPLDWCRNR